MVKSLLVGTALLGAGAFGLSGLPCCLPQNASGMNQAVAATTRDTPAPPIETVKIRVEGMSCGGCVVAVRVALTRLPGVQKADVGLDTQVAEVTFDSEKVTVEQITEAIKKVGFTPRLLEK